MTQKGKCLECKFCYVHDNDEERQLCCLQTKRGRLLTWTMRTGEVRNGVFIPDPTEELDKRMRDYMKNRIPPKWCIYRKQEQTMTWNKLKPCPFCGGKAEVHMNVFSKTYSVECKRCNGKVTGCKSSGQAFKTWNRRAGDDD